MSFYKIAAVKAPVPSIIEDIFNKALLLPLNCDYSNIKKIK